MTRAYEHEQGTVDPLIHQHSQQFRLQYQVLIAHVAKTETHRDYLDNLFEACGAREFLPNKVSEKCVLNS